ncbi:phosphodiesterase [Rhodoferax sp. PAMC 29310]|uniref:EAL domain-containing protein n=1 Tax=Rhodoferax sp. PAMC 29310 TaxID=2822760 RepID=UPI002108372B|nr:phosphodiesterase [Rhodoferax sp. PAMC 29310]
MIQRFGVLPRLLVLEITEHERVSDMDCLADVVSQIRTTGVSLALDDFGDGRSSLRLWSQLKPEFVKIDKYFTKDISRHADKLKTIQALQQIAAIFDTALVAEGIETEDDLRVLRDLGIAYGQCYFLGRPAIAPVAEIATAAQTTISDRRVSIYPELRRSATSGQLKQISAVAAPAVESNTTNDALAAIFLGQPDLHAVAVVDQSRPVGIINRARFLNEYTKLYYREVCGAKSCAVHINAAPRLIERNHNVDELIGILTSTDQRYLADGFIVTENGRYAGLGTGDQLVRSVMETRIEAARHANPLTFLPGNIPISQHIDRLLTANTSFVACYADLNNFKPFNDQYGYWRGDEMIRLVARLTQAHCDPLRDFVGHVGGDDFIILYQSADWELQCQRIVDEFALAAVDLFIFRPARWVALPARTATVCSGFSR